ncbi:MAG: signal recognition particle-docking protein FtsY [Candidatus Woesearchaeota archaeon]
MFKFLKDKLKSAVSKFSKKVDEEADEEKIEVEEQPEAEKQQEEEQKQKQEKAEKQKQAEEEKQKQEQEEQAKKQAEEEKQKQEEAEKQKQAEEEKQKQEQEEQKKQAEEEKKQEETEKQKQAEEEKQKQEQEEQAKKQAEEEKKKQEETEKQKQAEEEKQKQEQEEQKKQAEEEEKEQAFDEYEKKKGFFTKIKDSFKKKPVQEPEEEIISEEKEEQVDEDKKKQEQEKKKQQEEVEKQSEEKLEKPIEEKIDTEPVKPIEPKLEVEKQEVAEKQKAKKPESSKEIEDTIQQEADKIKQEKLQQKETKKDAVEEPEEKKGFFSRFKQSITTKKLSSDKFDDLFWEIEVALLENSVAVEVIEKIKQDLKDAIVNKPIDRKEIDTIIAKSMMDSITELFQQPDVDVIERINEKKKEKKPYVVCFVGINGSGKTTTIAKFTYMLKKKGFSPVIAASDTFRAAAIDQLEIHANKLGVKLIRHDYDADPAAVAFDAVKHAESKGKEVVLIDTAGRLHSNTNLMEELSKIVKVAKPDLVLFVGESITGNDCIEQAREFNKMVEIDGIILSKADIDQKGGAAISISYILNKPILYLGVGQNYEDLRPFSIDFILEQLSI